MLGYGFMGNAHSRALAAVRQLGSALEPELVSISGRDRDALEEARARLGWAEATTDWREQVADERVGLFVNGGPNALHAEPTIAAARAGKHVLCEKPLALSADEAHAMWRAAEDAGVVHATGFNYRFVPAVRLARELVQSGELGEIVHFRARYLQSWGWDAEPRRLALRPVGRRHGRAGRPRRAFDRPRASPRRRDSSASAQACARSFPAARWTTAFVATVEFENGATGTLEASRLARGRDQSQRLRAERDEGLGRIRPGADERAADLRRRRVPHGARARRLVAARAHHRLGRHVHVRVPAPAEGDRRRRHGRAATARRSRTATAARSSATRSSAPRGAAAGRRPSRAEPRRAARRETASRATGTTSPRRGRARRAGSPRGARDRRRASPPGRARCRATCHP